MLFKDALKNIVERWMSDPDHTASVAGAVLVRNSRSNIVTKMQEWDYFLGIAAIKRIQSMYQGTMVAHGAFSLYTKEVLLEQGGWPDTVGEDIVLTWGMHCAGHRVGFAEDAVIFTMAPDKLKQFMRQRERWSRGLIEAFKHHWRLLFTPRLSAMFAWWNILFPYLDVVYTFVFIPGLIAACFGYYYIAGPMTLALLPATLLLNYIMYRKQVQMFIDRGLKVRKNFMGFALYSIFYSMIMQPASIIGYVKEVLNLKKTWGTK